MIYTPSQPYELAAEFQGFATQSHVHLHHNWSLWERVPHGSGAPVIYRAKGINSIFSTSVPSTFAIVRLGPQGVLDWDVLNTTSFMYNGTDKISATRLHL